MSKVTYQAYTADEHRLRIEDIDVDALKIIYRLQQHHYQAYIVGGGVRDLLLRKKPKDFDIATDATPNQIQKIFRNSRIIGCRFKLVHIFFRGGKTIEVATFRKETSEAETDADNTVTGDNLYGTIASDALRRDLSINALFYDPSDQLMHDYVGGFADIKNRIIKIIGKPSVRFIEDPVRIIRTIRHLARTGFRLEQETAEAITQSIALLTNCPGSRIFEELRKDLLSGYFQEILDLMKEYQVLDVLIPEISERIREDTLLYKDLSSSIKGLDRYSLEHHGGSINIALTILALFSLKDFQLRSCLIDLFPTQQEINDQIRQSFCKLLVPRRNKKEVSDLIRMIWQIERADQKKKKFILKIDQIKDELRALMKILNIDQSRSHLNKTFRFQ